MKLKVRCGPNPRLEPLIDGTVKPRDIDLEFEVQEIDQLFYKNLHFDDFELSEMSISETLLARERRAQFGRGRWQWSAIPVFLSRGHGWTRTHVLQSSAIQGLADLKGKRVAVPDYDMTFALWMRCTLKDLYGIEAKDIAWYNMRSRGLSHGLELSLDLDPPPGVELHWLSPADDPVMMLRRGELDAAAGLPAPAVQGAADLRALLPDGGKAAISEYFRRTRCYQPNHHYVVQDRIIQEQPWIAMELYDAFERSKQVAYDRARRSQAAYLYFEGSDFRDQAAVFGEDPYPMGLRAMRPTLERLVRGSLEQGLIREPVALEQVYFPTTLAT